MSDLGSGWIPAWWASKREGARGFPAGRFNLEWVDQVANGLMVIGDGLQHRARHMFPYRCHEWAP